MSGTAEGTGAPTTGASDISVLESGRVKGTGITPELIKQGFDMAQERAKENAATPGITITQQPSDGLNETARALDDMGAHTENLSAEDIRRRGLEAAMTEQIAGLNQAGTVVKDAQTLVDSTGPVAAKPETPIVAVPTVEVSSAVQPTPATTEKLVVTETNPAEDWEAILEADEGQKTIETQREWIKRLDEMENNAIPYFVKLGIKGENPTTEQRNLILIQSFKDQDGSSEKYLVITKDGPRSIEATPENKALVIRRFLGKEDPSMSGQLEKLESTPLTLIEESDPISSVIEQSKDTAKKIADKRNEIKTLDVSKALAQKIQSSTASKATPGINL